MIPARTVTSGDRDRQEEGVVQAAHEARMVQHPVIIRQVDIRRKHHEGFIIIIGNQRDHDQNDERNRYADQEVGENGQEGGVLPLSYVDDLHPVAFARDRGVPLGKARRPDVEQERQDGEHDQDGAIGCGEAGIVFNGHGIIYLGDENIYSARAALKHRGLERTQAS